MSFARFSLTIAAVLGGMFAGAKSAQGQNLAYQGFETNIGDWTGPVVRVSSGGGTLHVPSFQGGYHAEVTNVHDTYTDPPTGYGAASYSFFDQADYGLYPGAFIQSISMYVFANTPSSGSVPGIWIDMSPANNVGGSNFDAEHNFRLTSTGSQVDVRVDGELTTLASITQSGWYTFQIGFRKAVDPTSPVLSEMTVLGPGGDVIGKTTLFGRAGSQSSDLGGPGYVWLTAWQNGWAGDVVAIDAVRVDLVLTGEFQIRYSSYLTHGDSMISITNTGLNGSAVFGPGFGGASGNMCVNVYTFSPDEQLISCCSCLVTPNGLVNLTANRDLVSNTLTGIRPDAIVVKLLASGAGSAFNQSSCNNSAALVNYGGQFPLANGMLAWGTTLHAKSAIDPPPPGTRFSITETPFSPGSLSPGDLASVKGRCTRILGNGSTFGQCASCRPGALGASKL